MQDADEVAAVGIWRRDGTHLQRVARYFCLSLEEVSPPRKQIVSSRSFGAMVTILDELAEAVSMYMSRAAEKLRHQNSVAGAMHVFVMTNQFRMADPQYTVPAHIQQFT